MNSSNLEPIHWLAISLFFLIPLIGISLYFLTQQSKSDIIADISPESTPKITPVAASPESSQLLASVTYSGGLCISGQSCESVVTIHQNGTVERDNEAVAQLPQEKLLLLVDEINEADYVAIMNQPFTGTCSVAFDGQELTYTFYLSGSTQVLPSCTYDLENVSLTTLVCSLIESQQEESVEDQVLP